MSINGINCLIKEHVYPINYGCCFFFSCQSYTRHEFVCFITLSVFKVEVSVKLIDHALKCEGGNSWLPVCLWSERFWLTRRVLNINKLKFTVVCLACIFPIYVTTQKHRLCAKFTTKETKAPKMSHRQYHHIAAAITLIVFLVTHSLNKQLE